MTHGQWIRSFRENFPAWVGVTDRISLCVVPDLGSKVVSLANRSTNREWLWSSGKPLGNKGYGTPFSSGDESGWDEMFPGINDCVYPEQPWMGERIPDHGEVWSLNWESHLVGDELRCKVEGVHFPYRFEKAYSFVGESTLRIEYALTNLSEHPFHFLWAAHPLLQAREGMRLHVPAGMEEIEVSYSAGNRLGNFGDIQPWPRVEKDGETIDLSVIGSRDSEVAEKYYFTGKMPVGRVGISDPHTGESMILRFPEDRVPYLAIWANSGGYGDYDHVALEPATGRMDDLNHAIKHKEASCVEGFEVYRWYLEVTIS